MMNHASGQWSILRPRRHGRKIKTLKYAGTLCTKTSCTHDVGKLWACHLRGSQNGDSWHLQGGGANTAKTVNLQPAAALCTTDKHAQCG